MLKQHGKFIILAMKVNMTTLLNDIVGRMIIVIHCCCFKVQIRVNVRSQMLHVKVDHHCELSDVCWTYSFMNMCWRIHYKYKSFYYCHSKSYCYWRMYIFYHPLYHNTHSTSFRYWNIDTILFLCKLGCPHLHGVKPCKCGHTTSQ